MQSKELCELNNSDVYFFNIFLPGLINNLSIWIYILDGLTKQMKDDYLQPWKRGGCGTLTNWSFPPSFLLLQMMVNRTTEVHTRFDSPPLCFTSLCYFLFSFRCQSAAWCNSGVLLVHFLLPVSVFGSLRGRRGRRWLRQENWDRLSFQALDFVHSYLFAFSLFLFSLITFDFVLKRAFNVCHVTNSTLKHIKQPDGGSLMELNCYHVFDNCTFIYDCLVILCCVAWL